MLWEILEKVQFPYKLRIIKFLLDATNSAMAEFVALC
jgi:hypothetical protein